MSLTTLLDWQEYVGYRIRVRGGAAGDLQGQVAVAEVRDAQDRPICRFTEYVEWGQEPRGWPSDQAGVTEALVQRAFHRARGAILLGHLNELDGQRVSVPSDVATAQRPEEYLRGIVLRAFKRVFRLNPYQRGAVGFDDLGVALIEGVDPGEIEYILERLRGDGMIEVFTLGHEPGYRSYKPTAQGLALADKVSDESDAPSLLAEETFSAVDRMLSRHAPELARRLRTLSMTVVEAPELSHADVSDIADQCHLILQDFFDLPALWQGVDAAKPPREKTKDRLSVILNARAGSETEQGLLPEFVALFDWLRDWMKFVHKYRHPEAPSYSERRYAKRLVLHTYLLLSDVSELLGL